MREIKFRAWDKKEKRMRQTHNISIDFLGGLNWQYGYDEPMPLIRDEYEIMQFTGLKDKNGKEVYDGDILRFRYGLQDKKSESESVIGLVQWNTAPYLRYGYGGKYLSDMDGNNEICWREDFGINQDKHSYYRICEFEVIGNIYENPELLKAVK